MIQVREKYNIIITYSSPFKESLYVLLDFLGFRFKVMCIDNTLANIKWDFVDLFDSFLEQISTERVPTIVCGDINIDKLFNNLLKSRHLNVIESNGSKILSIVLNRITQASRTCIYHVITQDIQCNVNAPEKSFSDYEALLVTINVKKKASKVT